MNDTPCNCLLPSLSLGIAAAALFLGCHWLYKKLVDFTAGKP
jgi:hypothetical protein